MKYYNHSFKTCFNCGAVNSNDSYICTKCNEIKNIHQSINKHEIELAIDTHPKDQDLIKAIIRSPDSYNKTIIQKRFYVEIETVRFITSYTRQKALSLAKSLNIDIESDLIDLINDNESSLHNIPITKNTKQHLSKVSITRYFSNPSLNNEIIQEILNQKTNINTHEFIYLLKRKDLNSITLCQMIYLSKNCEKNILQF